MKKLMEDIENIIRTKFAKKLAYCKIEYVFFFEDEIDIQIYEENPILHDDFDANYIEHRNQIAQEIRKKCSDKIRSMELYPNESDNGETYSLNGAEFVGIEIIVKKNKIRKTEDDIWIVI